MEIAEQLLRSSRRRPARDSGVDPQRDATPIDCSPPRPNAPGIPSRRSTRSIAAARRSARRRAGGDRRRARPDPREARSLPLGSRRHRPGAAVVSDDHRYVPNCSLARATIRNFLGEWKECLALTPDTARGPRRSAPTHASLAQAHLLSEWCCMALGLPERAEHERAAERLLTRARRLDRPRQPLPQPG